MISVCMATYNGERFLHEQLFSILLQLRSDDELIVVDDASRDKTVTIVESFSDDRIRLFRKACNSGVIRSIGRALEEARGDVILLADQDDVWRADKVSRIENVFSAYPDVSLVVSDCRIIDANGSVILESRNKTRKFHQGVLRNLVRNSYRGCTMAFRRSTLNYFLPFPADIPMHDMWIGIVNQFIGATKFIDEPLVSYRRHDRNESPERHASMVQMIHWRWALVKNLAILYARRVLFKRLSPSTSSR